MSFWSKYPFVRLLVPLTGGILLCYLTGSHNFHFPILLPAAALILLIGFNLFFVRKISYSLQWVSGILINIALIALGFSITTSSKLSNQPLHFANRHLKPDYYIAQVNGTIQQRAESARVPLKITAVSTVQGIVPVKGNVLCYFPEDSSATSAFPEYGDVIVFRKMPVRPDKPSGPWEFNYRRYLENSGIFHLVYLRDNEYRIAGHNQGYAVIKFAIHTRTKFLNLLRSKGLEGEEYAVASALLAGQDKEIDRNLYDAYSGAGVIHILSVSGLHVGIIYMLAGFFFSFSKRIRRIPFLEPVCIIMIVWLYALITGMAPPVLRASLMFTLIALGRIINRQSNTLNSLAAAAFILLLLQPLILFNVGFQLSFTAVAGIILIQPYFRRLWFPANPVISGLWDLTTVSVAAQVFTAPFILYYFHRFPTYFLFSNMLAVPLSGIIMYTGVLLILFMSVPVIGGFITTVLGYEIKILNLIVKYIDEQPGAVIENVNLSLFSAIVLMLLIVFLILYLVEKRRLNFYLAAVCVIILVSSASIRYYAISNQNKIVFHRFSRHSLVSFITGRNHSILTDSTVAADIQLARYQLEGLQITAGLKSPVVQRLSCPYGNTYSRKEGTLEFYSFKGKRIVVVTGNCRLPVESGNVKADFVLLCNNPSVDVSDIKSCFPGAILIADNSCSIWKINELKNEAALCHVAFHSLPQQGTLIIDVES